MLAIAGGIILAVIFFTMLPLILLCVIWLVIAVVYLGVASAIVGWGIMPAVGAEGLDVFLSLTFFTALVLAAATRLLQTRKRAI